MNKNLKAIKEKIHTINPKITDELLELLCEFILNKHFYNLTNLQNCISNKTI